MFVSDVEQCSHVVKVLSVLDSRHFNVIKAHTDSIRDLSLSKESELILSASFDKCLCVSSFRTLNPVLRFECSSRLWSCCWDNSGTYAFAASANGLVSVFDTRSTRGAIKTLPLDKSRSMPVHSLVFTDSCSLLASSLGCTKLLFSSDKWGSVSEYEFELDGKRCSSAASFEDQLFLSVRGATEQKGLLFKIKSESEVEFCSSLCGFENSTVLSKSSLGSSLLCTSDESSQRTIVLDTDSSQTIFMSESHPSHVTQSFLSRTSKLVLSLSSELVHIYSL